MAAWPGKGKPTAHPQCLAVKKLMEIFFLSQNFRPEMQNVKQKNPI